MDHLEVVEGLQFWLRWRKEHLSPCFGTLTAIRAPLAKINKFAVKI
jgi:hypothetical protein